MAASERSCLKGLNDRQLEAVLHEGSPLLILAGAGSGKTRVITTKIAHLVDNKGIDPASILAVTFTNKAAQEMHGRVLGMVPGAERVMVRTFHSFGAWLLRRFGESIGLSPHFVIYDDDDSLTLLHGLYPEFTRRELSRYSRLISRVKDFRLLPGDDLSAVSTDPDLPGMYEAYERRLRQVGNADFGDLILRASELLSAGRAREYAASRFAVVLVDEYQDSNVAQYRLLRELFHEGTYLCVVGDDDQSIYRFRGAEVRNIITFPDSFPGTRIIRLEQNYRSTEAILALASEVVGNNAGRLGKRLWTERRGGPMPVLTYLDDHLEEAAFCADLLSDGKLEGTAILYRMNAQSLPFETLFTRADIPYRIVGALRFYDREEVKDVIAFLSLLVNSRDEVSAKRIVNKPARGLGKSTIQKVIDAALSSDGDIVEALRGFGEGTKGKARASALGFVNMIEVFRAELENAPLGELVERVVKESGLLDYHRGQDEVSGTQKMQNLEQIVNAASEYPSGVAGLSEFLEIITLDRSRGDDRADDGRPRVTLITMHNTKGLEFDRVVITGLEDGIFPGKREDDDDDDLEEERRIFYVAITRARNELYLTSCRRRQLWGRTITLNPSRFLGEFTPGLVTIRGKTAEAADGFPKGSAVYHEEYGTGIITARWHKGGELAVQVQFESGRQATFIPRYTPALEPVEADW